MKTVYIYAIVAICLLVGTFLLLPEFKSTAFTNKGDFMFLGKDGKMNLVSGDTLDNELNNTITQNRNIVNSAMGSFGGFWMYEPGCNGGILACGKHSMGVGCDRSRRDAGVCVGGNGWTRLLYSNGQGGASMGVKRH